MSACATCTIPAVLSSVPDQALHIASLMSSYHTKSGRWREARVLKSNKWYTSNLIAALQKTTLSSTLRMKM